MLLYAPMVLLLDLVLGNGKLDDAGEPRGGAHGAPPRRSGEPAGRPHAPPSTGSGPFDRGLTDRIRRYPFAAKIAKEPLFSFRFNPRSFAGLKNTYPQFKSLKAYFLPAEAKIRFSIFTELPFTVFCS